MITFVLIDFTKQSIPGGSDKWGEGRSVKWSLWVLWSPVILKTFKPVRGWRVKPLRCLWHIQSLSVVCSRTKTDSLFQIHHCISQFHSWRVNSVHSLCVASSRCLSLYHIAFIEYLHLLYFTSNSELQLCSIFTFWMCECHNLCMEIHFVWAVLVYIAYLFGSGINRQESNELHSTTLST